eukprot:SAG31_NODE_40472_length_280_cov_1.149171_1_plen_42_part_10
MRTDGVARVSRIQADGSAQDRVPLHAEPQPTVQALTVAVLHP